MNLFFKYFVLTLSLNAIEGSFRCDYSYSLVAKAWFKHNVIPATWAEARLRCSLEGATLASPTTSELEAEMTHIIKNFFTSESEIFTGIHATLSGGDYHTIEGIPLSDIPLAWAENEPDNRDNNERCITFNGNGEIADHSCEDTRPYICYTGNIETKVTECGTHDPEYRFDARTEKCYKLHTVPRNFSRANLACTAEGGHLAIINSDVEATVLKELFEKYPPIKMLGNYWKEVAFVGFHDWGEDGDWRTINGQTLWEAGYSTFLQGEPNNKSPGERCGSIYRSGKLNDLWCHIPAAFFCEKSPDIPAVCETNEQDQNGNPVNSSTPNQ